MHPLKSMSCLFVSAPWELWSVWLLNYHNLRFRAHLITFKGGVVDAIPHEGMEYFVKYEMTLIARINMF